MGTRSPDVPDTYLTDCEALLAVTDVTSELWKNFLRLRQAGKKFAHHLSNQAVVPSKRIELG
jgi:hypothetical protein